MKILAVVITYYPDVELLFQNVHAFKEHVDKVIVWENTPVEEAIQLRLPIDEKILYFGNNKNVGISKGLNFAWHYAKDNGYDLLLTMDQDSQFKNFGTYKQDVITRLSDGLAIFSPNVNNELCMNNGHNLVQFPYIITSGMLIPISALDNIGGFRADFFVDAIDIALSVEATEHKIPLYKVRSGQLVQQYGNARYRVIFGKKFYGVNYSLFRYESIYRNHIILLRQYPHNNDLKKLVKRYYKSHIKGIIFVEQNKMAKIWAIIKGTYAGLLYKL